MGKVVRLRQQTPADVIGWPREAEIRTADRKDNVGRSDVDGAGGDEGSFGRVIIRTVDSNLARQTFAGDKEEFVISVRCVFARGVDPARRICRAIEITTRKSTDVRNIKRVYNLRGAMTGDELKMERRRIHVGVRFEIDQLVGIGRIEQRAIQRKITIRTD